MLKNTNETYGAVAKLLHWFMAILIIVMLISGFFLEDLKDPMFYKVHKAIGFILLVLAVVRIFWRLINPVLGYDKSFSKLMIYAAHLGHYTLYFLMIAMPLSAFIASNAALRPVSFLFLFDLPLLMKEKNQELAHFLMGVHGVLALAFVAVITLHFAAALYHHLIRKDNVLIRMLPNLCQPK